MKTLGFIGITAGTLMVAIGGICLFAVGIIALTPVLIGLIAILCGAICIAFDSVHTRLHALDSKLSETEDLIRSQIPTAAQDIVDQLRQEGVLRSEAKVTDDDVEEMLD